MKGRTEKGMRQRILSSLQTLLADRPVMLILALLLAGSAGLLLYLGFSIQPGELQVVVHYTSFGTTNFYRDKWYYLLSFSAFAIIMAVMHIALTYKVLIQKGHDMAVAFAWLGVALLVITASIAYQVLKIASLT